MPTPILPTVAPLLRRETYLLDLYGSTDHLGFLCLWQSPTSPAWLYELWWSDLIVAAGTHPNDDPDAQVHHLAAMILASVCAPGGAVLAGPARAVWADRHGAHVARLAECTGTDTPCPAPYAHPDGHCQRAWLGHLAAADLRDQPRHLRPDIAPARPAPVWVATLRQRIGYHRPLAEREFTACERSMRTGEIVDQDIAVVSYQAVPCRICFPTGEPTGPAVPA